MLLENSSFRLNGLRLEHALTEEALCENMSFGVNSLLLTTLRVAFGALFIAVPLGVGCAIYLSEYASPRLVAVVKPTLEILAGIPSVVYGFFAFIYIGPIVVSIGEFAFGNVMD